MKGPNLMLGYLGQPEKTAAVIRDGWYVTGDIACLDEEGFQPGIRHEPEAVRCYALTGD